MPRSDVAPPGARLPLVVLAVALAVGALMFVRVHRGHAGSPPEVAAGPGAGSTPSARDRATP